MKAIRVDENSKYQKNLIKNLVGVTTERIKGNILNLESVKSLSEDEINEEEDSEFSSKLGFLEKVQKIRLKYINFNLDIRPIKEIRD